jgi:hypothetical protein
MCIYCNTNNYRKIYENHNGAIPVDSLGRRYDIHHKDGDHLNNSPENLIALSIEDHYNEHYKRGDYGSCYLIAIQRLNKTREEISELAKLNARQQIEKGTHPFLGGELQLSRVKNKTHPFLGDGSLQRKVQQDRIDSGTHHLLGENHWKFDHKIYNFHNSKTGVVENLTRNEFCKKHNINTGNLSEVIKGKRMSVQGWKIL